MSDSDSSDVTPDQALVDLLGSGPADFAKPREREFAPWHRPRKQYVRTRQWCREIAYLVRDLEIRGSFRYFTLPGSDLLDVRQIASSICASENLRLTYLGFNSAITLTDAIQSETDISQFSVNRMSNVDVESEVFPGDFRGVGNPESIYSRRMRRGGPFHAINLDLCDGFAGKPSANGLPNYFSAVKALLEHQHYWRQEFLLFLTTRIDEDSVAVELREKVPAIAQDVADSCGTYADELASAWELDSNEGVSVVSAPVTSSEAFMLGLTQWIVDVGVEIGLRARVRSVMTYRTGNGTEGADDIASIAIRFKPEPNIVSDRHGMVSSTPATPSPAERRCEQSAHIPSRVARRQLVDVILREDAERFAECFEQSSELLEAAGYDPHAYRDWVMEERDRYAAA